MQARHLKGCDKPIRSPLLCQTLWNYPRTKSHKCCHSAKKTNSLTNPHKCWYIACTWNETLLQDSVWNEAAKMSGRQGLECKFRNTFSFVKVFFFYLAQDTQGWLIIMQHSLLLWKLCNIKVWSGWSSWIQNCAYATCSTAKEVLCLYIYVLLWGPCSPPLNLHVSCSMNGLAFVLV